MSDLLVRHVTYGLNTLHERNARIFQGFTVSGGWIADVQRPWNLQK